MATLDKKGTVRRYRATVPESVRYNANRGDSIQDIEFSVIQYFAICLLYVRFGVTPFSISIFPQFFQSKHVLHNEYHIHIWQVASLWRHLSNVNVIQRNKHIFLQNLPSNI